MTILPFRRLYIERQIQPEMLSFVSNQEVVDLFNMWVILFLIFSGKVDFVYPVILIVCMFVQVLYTQSVCTEVIPATLLFTPA